MIERFGEYEIDDSRERIDLDRVHAWLASTYWSPDVPRETVERAWRHSSAVIGAYAESGQVGYMRIVSDRATFAWLCDVYVDEAHRGRGIARAMVAFALRHPDHQGLRQFLLATRDAHEVYAPLGFKPITNPERWMQYRPAGTQPAP